MYVNDIDSSDRGLTVNDLLSTDEELAAVCGALDDIGADIIVVTWMVGDSAMEMSTTR
jgi:adenine phosphoribosyltransferase